MSFSLSLSLCLLFLLNAVESKFCQLRTDLECTVWLVLFILGRPQQLDLDVQLAVGLEVHPDLVERLLRLADQVGQREFAVGDEVVGGNGGTGGNKHEEHVTGGSTGKSIKSITCETQ